MILATLLAEKKTAILARWFDTILETYPSDTSKFLKEQPNRFANPVGSTILAGIESILNELMAGGDQEKLSLFLDNIIRVRAVQDFTPSQAISFVFSLKHVVREELRVSAVPAGALEEFEEKVDSLALLSFDIFMKCREKLYDLKANELRNMTFRLVQRANALGDVQNENPAPEADDLDNDKQQRGN